MTTTSANMAIDLQQELRIDYLADERLQRLDIRLGILRLDEIHPLVSGNKWFKLKENIRLALQEGATTLLTFGGAFSNHLLATAAAARASGLASVGIVRGFHAQEQLSPTLQQCVQLGMRLHFVSRDIYRNKKDAAYLSALQHDFPQSYILPEGGDNAAGMLGAGDIAAYLPHEATLVALAIGTGTTFAGIRRRLDNSIAMLGFPVMKGGGYLEEEIRTRIISEQGNWQLDIAYAFGGFARHTAALIDFMNAFYDRHNIPLDFVYTAKMMYGLYDRIEKGTIPPGSHIIAIHTGGLQGNSSIGDMLVYS